MTSTERRDFERDAEIDRYKVDGLPQDDLDDLALMAAHLCQMPVAMINLMRAGTQVTIAAAGVDAGMCSREDSMCNAVLYDDAPVQVSDASVDPRWLGNPFVDGTLESFRFYAAHQLITPRGVVIGTLCVFDREPRALDADADLKLSLIARRVVDLLELRLRARELEETVAELIRARNELHRSNEVLGIFAGQVAHDLRGPLTSVGLSLGMLQQELGDLDEDAQWLLRRALASTSRMDALIGEMLSFASLGGRPDLVELDLSEVVAQIREDLSAELGEVDLEVTDLPVVEGDPTQWRIVLQNLVSNAVKFADPGVRPLVRISASTGADGSWSLEVADNGPGVSPEQREAVFGLLAQGDHGRGGVGLGLATCLRIVEAHGGTIVLEEAPEGGALVRIDVPIRVGPNEPVEGSVAV